MQDLYAILLAWETICHGATRNPTLLVPAGKTFLLNPIDFTGPCKPSIVTVQIDGNIVASRNLEVFDVFQRERWLSFSNVNELHVYAKGLIDGNGDVWWTACSKTSNCQRPTLLAFFGCHNLIVNGLRTHNSGRNHISINNVHTAVFSNLHLNAPENSHNTDGIDIATSTLVRIEDSNIETGDDCIAINSGVFNLHIDRGGRGYAKNIWFTDITLIDSDNPIIINQLYFAPVDGSTDVKISDVHFNGVRGTTTRDTAINLQCSKTMGCHGIYLNDINITPSRKNPPKSRLTAICTNAHGKAWRTTPAATCLSP
ncbi:hypothetical protein ACFE04_031383 [Oxalis oulophora]